MQKDSSLNKKIMISVMISTMYSNKQIKNTTFLEKKIIFKDKIHG
jgi:hypothetical protein